MLLSKSVMQACNCLIFKLLKCRIQTHDLCDTGAVSAEVMGSNPHFFLGFYRTAMINDAGKGEAFKEGLPEFKAHVWLHE